MARPEGKPRAWQRMLSGRRLDLINPSPLDVEIEDIAHGLARVSRWNGQTIGDDPFSVAQHSLLVADIARELKPDWPAKWRLVALLHDAPEYVIGDLISPFKAALALDYKAFEAGLLTAIHLRFGLPGDVPAAVIDVVKRADRISAYFEATRLAGFGEDEAARLFGRPRGLGARAIGRFGEIAPWPAKQAQEAFLERFAMLMRGFSAAHPPT